MHRVCTNPFSGWKVHVQFESVRVVCDLQKILRINITYDKRNKK